jgi:putative ubiquitin-RnfH superfamily antitoxin RatB of RatAB toxin-antitoxin module
MPDIHVQVCYAKSAMPIVRDLRVPTGTTVQSAIEQSGVVLDAPEIELTTCRVGIYGKLKALDTVLREHDRVEIYRPLVADPKESRRKRAAGKANKKAP